jgi:branched-subunit amino acid aminotransferase/4-amino-4-deoxychorismate lyase
VAKSWQKIKVVAKAYWYDGQLLDNGAIVLSIEDPAFLYGATVFTTLRVYGDSLEHPRTHWQAHCDRLRQSVNAFGWVEPEWPRLRCGAAQLLARYPVLRMTLFPDGRELITGRDLPLDLAQRQQQGITAWMSDLGLRSLPHHKTGNYLLPWLALQQAQSQGAQEAILTDPIGNWLETSTGTLWGYGQATWWTPAIAAGLLPGIQRQHILAQLAAQQMPYQETIWNRPLIEALDLLAYSNAVVEIIPIHTLLSAQAAAIAFSNPAQALETLRSCLAAA